MPSASTKPEKPASQEVVEPLKQLVTVVDKKIRNLEKKKGKLESYRVEYQKGALLNEDQKNAISRYDEVVHSLEFAKELQKQFYQIALEFTKNQKKQARQEQLERQTYQLLRTGEMLALQELLNNLGLENVREDFLVGNNGAVVLKEEELNQLDELYKLISPTREAGDYEASLKAAAEHLVFVLDGRKKSVIGTTYKDLKDLITKINECSYFDRPPIQDPVENGDEVEDRVEEVMEPEIIEQVYDIPANEIDENKLEVQSSLSTTTTTLGTTSETLEEPQVTLHVISNTAPDLDNSYFSSAPYTQPTLAIHEVLPSVQDNFNFLQESQIDLESPHMDPAVVAALPMVPSSSQSIPYPQQTEPSSQQYSQQTYQGQNSPVSITPSNDLQPKTQRSTSAPQQQSGPPINQPLETQTFTNQNYVMAAHSLIGSGSSTAPTLSHPNHTPSSQPDTTPSAPLPIPLPNQQQLLQQQNAAVAAAVLSAPKQFSMNVNAAAFHAVSLKQSPHESALSLQQMTGPQLQSQQQQLADLHGGYQHNQQTSGFPRTSTSCGNNNGRGIRGSRGGGRGGPSNGYSRGATRGSYSNGRGNSRYGGNGMRGTQTRGGGSTRGGRGGFNKLQQGPQPQQASA